MATDGIYLHFKYTHGSRLLNRNNTQMQYINAGLLLYQSILLSNAIISDLMSIFDPNSTPVCLLELYHLCRRIITDVRMRHELTAM